MAVHHKCTLVICSLMQPNRHVHYSRALSVGSVFFCGFLHSDRTVSAETSRALHAGRLEELSMAQRERVLQYLLERLHMLEGPQKEILGAACPTTPTQRTLVLPPLAAKTSAAAAAQLPDERQVGAAEKSHAVAARPLRASPWCGLPSGVSKAATTGLVSHFKRPSAVHADTVSKSKLPGYAFG
jgi:hypothetical protein